MNKKNRCYMSIIKTKNSMKITFKKANLKTFINHKNSKTLYYNLNKD